MKQIPSQPIFRYLRYPASPTDVVVDATCRTESSNMHDILSPLRGQILQPVFITSTFWQYMVKSMNAFRGVMMDVVKESDGSCGCLTTSSYGNMMVGNVSCQLCSVWLVFGGAIHSYMFMSFSGKSYLIGYMTNNADGSYKYCISDKVKRKCEAAENEMLSALSGLTTGAIILLCLEKYANVEVKDLRPGKTHRVNEDGETVEYKAMGCQPFQILDCRWFTEICSDKDFSVNGHFRMQPYKDKQGHWQKKLIYVNTYVKHGYHRKATLDKIRESMNQQYN